MEKVSTGTYWIHLLFALYFVILLAERVQSLVRSLVDPSVLIFGDGFNGYTYTITILSLVASLVCLISTNAHLFAGIFTRSAAVHGNVQMSTLCLAAGLILVSGMVHTEYTIAPMQFGAYGALIIAIIIQTALMQGKSARPGLLWLSMAFLIAFSMAIPVMYRSHIELSTLFHVLEAVAALVLVFFFTVMLYRVFNEDATDLFTVIPMLAVSVLDAILIIMRLQEEINWFVLIALAATSVLYVAGVITKHAVK